MAFFQTSYKSSVLNIECGINVILPDKPKTAQLPCLWLLHGLSDDHTCWQRYSAIEHHARQYQLGVVMPAVNRSFYADMSAGGKYYTYLSEELPQALRRFFPLSDKPARNFLAGLSMGGYGAFLLALRNPDRYASAASFSGALDICACYEKFKPDADWIFGKPPAGTSYDLFHLLKQLKSGNRAIPALSLYCGQLDAEVITASNTRMHTVLQDLEIPHRYDESPVHAHTWDYWDACIRDVLKRLPVKPA